MLLQNQAITNFCSGDLKEKKELSGKTPLLMSNFSFLIKMSMMQVLFVGLSSFPASCLVGLLILELLYLGYNLGLQIKYKHLRNFFILVPKLTQSIFLLIIEFIMLKSFLSLSNTKYALSEGVQNTLSTLFLVSNIVEYAVILLNIVLITRLFCIKRKRKELDPKYRIYIEENESFLVYKKISNQSGVNDQQIVDCRADDKPKELEILEAPLRFRKVRVPCSKNLGLEEGDRGKDKFMRDELSCQIFLKTGFLLRRNFRRIKFKMTVVKKIGPAEQK